MEWLSSGLVAAYEPSNARIVIVDERLRRVATWGRTGPGPGELSTLPPQMIESDKYDRLAAADSTVYVVDTRGVHAFEPRTGAFRGTSEGAGPGSFNYLWVSEVHPAPDALLVVVDSLERRDPGDAGRRIQTWRVAEGDRRLLFEVDVAPPPKVGPRHYFRPPNQAHPLWAARGGCVLMSDGSSGTVYRYDPAPPGRLDTLHVAQVDGEPVAVPDSVRDDYRRLSQMMGRDDRGFPEPTAPKRWDELRIDPDGWLWMRPYIEPTDEGPIVVRVNPETGRSAIDTVPAFPAAFGRPGEFYAIGDGPVSGTQQITRYVVRTEQSGGSP